MKLEEFNPQHYPQPETLHEWAARCEHWRRAYAATAQRESDLLATLQQVRSEKARLQLNRDGWAVAAIAFGGIILAICANHYIFGV